jgi:AraC-like DNA-binding protein
MRLQTAANLLAGTLKTVKEVAAEVGYRYPSSFVREFREFHGQTPVECRAANQAVVDRSCSPAIVAAAAPK